MDIDPTKTIDQMIEKCLPGSWVFLACDLSTCNSMFMRESPGSVTLRRCQKDMDVWHSLDEETKEYFQIYAIGTGNTFGEALAQACDKAQFLDATNWSQLGVKK